MQQVVIKNPILNSPFQEPTRHFRFSNKGITNDIVEARRVSSYFIPIAKPKKRGKAARLDLFADFNGIKFEEMVEFYQHEQNWSNRMIPGDSLLVMSSLAEKEDLKGRVQMIYITASSLVPIGR